MNGDTLQVIRPDDGAVIPLTCTKEQFKEVWEPLGYKLAKKDVKADPDA